MHQVAITRLLNQVRMLVPLLIVLRERNSDGFYCIIQEDARAGSDDTFQLFLKDVAAVEDEDQVVQSFQNDGVILHVPVEAYSGEIEELVEGDKVKCRCKASRS